MKRLFVALVMMVTLSLTAACGSSESAGNETKVHHSQVKVEKKVDRSQEFLTAFKKEEPHVKGTDKQLVGNAVNICGYVHTKDDWVTVADTGEFAGLQGGSGAVSLNIVDASLKHYCPSVWARINK